MESFGVLAILLWLAFNIAMHVEVRREFETPPAQSLTFISTQEDLIKYIVELDKAKSVCDIDYVYEHGCMPPRYAGGYISVGSITADRIIAASITFGGKNDLVHQ